MDRRSVGAWLAGPKAALQDNGIDLGEPGARLGLPVTGPGSVARAGRRIVALFIDWLACLALAKAIDPGPTHDSQSLLVLELFFAQVTVLTALTGSSFGQRLVGVGIRRVTGGRLSAVRCAIRTALVCLVIPAVVWDRDGRGLHDKVVDSVAVRLGRPQARP